MDHLAKRHAEHQPPARTARDKVRTPIDAAPPRRKTRAHSSTVAPVVKTSSTSTIRLPLPPPPPPPRKAPAPVPPPPGGPEPAWGGGGGAAQEPIRHDWRAARGSD